MQLTAKILAIYFLMGSFLPRTDFSQILRLHDLVLHYEVHVLEANDRGEQVNWVDFLADHFVTPNQHQHPNNGDAGHHNLPLQSINTGLNLIIANTSFSLIYPAIQYQLDFPQEAIFVPEVYKASIFQPPAC